MSGGGSDNSIGLARTVDGEGLSRYPRLLLFVMCSAQLVLSIDFNVVNIANPTIERELHFNAANLQWNITAYALTFGGFLLLGGRMVDLFGKRRLFVIGIVAFAATSLCAGTSHTMGELIASRAAQGVCAAIVSPAVLALLAASFPEGRPRQRAYAMWATAGSIGGLVGLLVGGVITSQLGWRWIFFINVPICALAVLGAAVVLPKMLPSSAPRGKLDIPGAFTVTAGLALVIYGLGEAESTSWTSRSTLVSLSLAPVFILGFWWVERRSREPLIPFALLRRRAAVANVLAVFQQSAGITTAFLAPLLLQQVWGFSPLHSGIATLPLPLGFGIGARVSAKVAARFGSKEIILAGFILIAIGCAWLTQVPFHESYIFGFAVPMTIRSFGQGLVIVQVALVITSGVPSADQGIAAGLFNMSGQLGGSIGLAGIATVLAAASAADGGGRLGELHGIRVAFVVAAVLPLVATAVTVFGLRNRTAERPSVESAPTSVEIAVVDEST